MFDTTASLFDLNLVGYASTQEAIPHEHRPNSFRSNHVSVSYVPVSTMRETLPRQSSSSDLLLFRSIALHGFCAADPSRESAGLGIRGHVSRSTLADANEHRDWRVYADLARVLIGMARPLYANEPFGMDLDETVYALDATTVDVSISLCPGLPMPVLAAP